MLDSAYDHGKKILESMENITAENAVEEVKLDTENITLIKITRSDDNYSIDVHETITPAELLLVLKHLKTVTFPELVEIFLK